jgi:hypothetical protein
MPTYFVLMPRDADELEWIWKEAAVAYVLSSYPRIRLEGLRKTMKNLSQDSRSRGRDLNTGLPEYEAGVLTTRTQRSVSVLLRE